ncbi:MAG: phosphate ABC transporter permease PstA [Planctomycetes bacterium]|nr:phosphate ABC transporter permease PstA [Planctomycetota bacterium]
MRLRLRLLTDKVFTSFSMLTLVFAGVFLLVFLGPIFIRGAGAFIFKGTVEHRKVIRDLFERSDGNSLAQEIAATNRARQQLYARLTSFENEMAENRDLRMEYKNDYEPFKESLRVLLGPLPGDPIVVTPRKQYGQTRWDRALVKYKEVMNTEEWDYSNPDSMGQKILVPRRSAFAGTSLERVFDEDLDKDNLKAMLRPRLTFYWRFLTDSPKDSYIFGGIWPALVGTFYLTIGAMLFAIPAGILAAIYLAEYAGETTLVSIVRSCISTLAGVPSIVFGLFGLAFFINTMHVSSSKSVLAGSLTLGLLVLPTIIRAAEEAIKSVPKTYKEAALGLGASKFRTILTVILPVALPGILTGIVISMGRAAGETAPIIFTAAVSAGVVLTPLEAFSNPTQALPWSIYNLCTEHEAVDEIRHVQYGMVLTLITIVLLLNAVAIILRAKVERKLRG